MANTFFIQNQWTDERKEEVEDSKAHSLHVLKKIAEACHLPIENIEIEIIGIYQVLNATINSDAKALEKYGYNRFVEKLQKFSNKWSYEIDCNMRNSLIKIISDTIKVTVDRIFLNSKNAEELNVEFEKRKMEFDKEWESKKRITDEAMDKLQEDNVKLKKIVKDECKVAAENLRNAVRELISLGVTGGDKLNDAFQDHQEQQSNLAFEKIQPHIIEFTQSISEEIVKIGDFNNSNTMHLLEASFKKKTGIHVAYTPVAGATGAGLGTYWGAAIGTMILPGIGTFVGGIIGGLLGGLFGGWLGNKARNYHVGKQKEATRRELFKYIDQYQKDLENSFINNLNDYLRAIEESFNEWLDIVKKEHHENIDSLIAQVAQTKQEMQYKIYALENDKKELEKYYLSLEQGVQK
jgi:gas vesicle protein